MRSVPHCGSGWDLIEKCLLRPAYAEHGGGNASPAREERRVGATVWPRSGAAYGGTLRVGPQEHVPTLLAVLAAIISVDPNTDKM